MSRATHAAIKCFKENITLFGNARTQPENYNLYQGLCQLAEAVEGIESALATLAENQKALANMVHQTRHL